MRHILRTVIYSSPKTLKSGLPQPFQDDGLEARKSKARSTPNAQNTIISLWWSSALITLALHLLCTSHRINTIDWLSHRILLSRYVCIFKRQYRHYNQQGGGMGICYHYSIFIEYLDCSWGRKRARLQAFDNCPSNSHVKIVSSTLLPTRLGIKK